MEIQDILNLLIWFQILNKYDQKYILVFLKIALCFFVVFKIRTTRWQHTAGIRSTARWCV